MIFPTKHMPLDRSLFLLGAKFLIKIDEPKSISQLWESVSRDKKIGIRISYDWFILTLIWLYSIAALDYEGGLLRRENR